MSAKNYMPYIEGVMEHVKEIYRWNEEVDIMRVQKAINQQKDAPRGVTLPKVDTVQDYHKSKGYDFNAGLRLYYEERGEYTTGKLEDNLLDQVDALVDQFVVAIGEIRKCALSDSYEKIDFWETKANEAYWYLDVYIRKYTLDQLDGSEEEAGLDEFYDLHEERVQQSLTAVIDALFTRFGDDAYIDENGKFIKSKGYTKPDLSFLLK